jgi:hypothetical protein
MPALGQPDVEVSADNDGDGRRSTSTLDGGVRRRRALGRAGGGQRPGGGRRPGKKRRPTAGGGLRRGSYSVRWPVSGLCLAVMAESSCGVIWGKLMCRFFPEPVCSMVVRSGVF